MKLISIKPLLIALCLLVTLASCDKEKDEEVEPSRTELLTANNWKGDRILVAGTDAANYPNAGDFVPDPKSLSITFKTDGTYAASYVQNGQTIPASGNWEFSSDEQSITGNLFGISSDAKIETLTDTNLTLSTTVDVPDFPLPVPVEIRLVR
ncbi:hypothetical protein MKJ04_17440 [Pontibacter sp. E15-1]|uniref:hypothetical protein n=1 Tax=Pontibacter sp. E15-1 TaxID=2919918 RepID=UPI001F4F42E9|nr:hypothetical protein [Pontibacter sp. E15-1]MCJ8166633.1 hypothetical protein [Pontibacter sp. E15-1]